MKKYKLEQFLEDPQADVATGLLVSRSFGFCFTLKKPHRWGKTKEGFPILPFGGIGGKLEPNELPSTSLHRETIEEVGSDVEIIEVPDKETILIDQKSIEKISLTTNLSKEPLPIIIFRSPRAEANRKLFTNILIYTGRFTSDKIAPLDDPAIVELETELLLELREKSLSVKEFQEKGGKITSRIDLPDNGILKPIGTALALTYCLQAGFLTSQILK